MVCLDAFTHKARPVNGLIPMTEDEKKLYAMGEGKRLVASVHWCLLKFGSTKGAKAGSRTAITRQDTAHLGRSDPPT